MGNTGTDRMGFQTYNYKPKLSTSKWISGEKHTNYKNKHPQKRMKANKIRT